MKTELINKRKKLLDYFISKIVSYNFFYISEPFQIFIRGPPDYIKAVNFKHPTYIEIAERFQQTFSDVRSFEMSQEIEEQLSQALNILNESLIKAKQFKKVGKKNVLSFYRYEDSFKQLSDGIKDAAHYFLPSNNISVEFNKKISGNPYKVLLDWGRKTVLEVESILEAIDAKHKLDNIVNLTQTKLDKQNQSLQSFHNGKRSLFQKLTKKTDEQKLTELESGIQYLEIEIKALHEIIRYATGRLIQYQLPLFQEKEVEKLESTIRCYSGLVVEEYNDFNIHFKSLQEAISPPVI